MSYKSIVAYHRGQRMRFLVIKIKMPACFALLLIALRNRRGLTAIEVILDGIPVHQLEVQAMISSARRAFTIGIGSRQGFRA